MAVPTITPYYQWATRCGDNFSVEMLDLGSLNSPMGWICPSVSRPFVLLLKGVPVTD